MMTFHLITIFPEIFDSYLNESILKRAQSDEKVEIKVYNLRDFADDKHKTVDDTPYGGGPGMVLKVGPVYRCIEKIKSDIKKRCGSEGEFLISNSPNKISKSEIVTLLTSAKGREYSQADAEKFKSLDDIIIICGRYEGVDERVAQHIADEEISIGKYVLTGGELPAMVIVDSVSRLLPGVLGNEESLESESHSGLSNDDFRMSNEKQEKKLIDNRQSTIEHDFPVYTKPEEFNDWKVPDVLLSGNHEEIKKWRDKKV